MRLCEVSNIAIAALISRYLGAYKQPIPRGIQTGQRKHFGRIRVSVSGFARETLFTYCSPALSLCPERRGFVNALIIAREDSAINRFFSPVTTASQPQEME